MPRIVRSALVERAPTVLFDLVDAVEDYPSFLPWCVGSSVAHRDDEVTEATIQVGLTGFRTAFTTRNRKQRPHRIELALVDGPFSDLSGAWAFTPLGDVGTKVELTLEYAFANPQLEKVAGRVFEEIARTMIDRFVAQALKT
jgi:ribosome-associated toxin RatA of RatAB toxin-antitoxin module